MDNGSLMVHRVPLLGVKGRRMPLIMLQEGAQGTVVEIHGGRGLNRRLAELGFNVGEKVRMIKNHRPGPVMVEVKDSRVALGRGVTMKILIEEDE